MRLASKLFKIDIQFMQKTFFCPGCALAWDVFRDRRSLPRDGAAADVSIAM